MGKVKESREELKAKYPVPEKTGVRHKNDKDYPWRIVTSPELDHNMPNLSKWVAECGHILIKRSGSVTAGDEVGCHLCGGAVGRRKVVKAARGMNKAQLAKVKVLIRQLDDAGALLADMIVRMKLEIWDAFAGDKRLTPDGDVLLTAHEVSTLALVHEQSVRRWRSDGHLSRPQKIGANYYYRLSEVMKLMRRKQMARAKAKKPRHHDHPASIDGKRSKGLLPPEDGAQEEIDYLLEGINEELPLAGELGGADDLL